jgi:putative transposase
LAQRLEVASVFIGQGHSVQKVIKIASIANSTWHSQYHRVKEDKRKDNPGRPVPGYTVNPDGSIIVDNLIVTALLDYRSRKEFANGGGYHKLSEYLRRDYNYVVNPKKIYRLCSENDLLLPKRKKRKKPKSKICINRVITRPHQMWELDLKYGYVHGENRFFFILAIIDVYMKLIVNYYIGLRCTGRDLVFTLEDAIKKFEILDKTQLVIRSDNGSQMTSNAFISHIGSYKEDQLLHELIPPATPNKNAHIEAFNSIIEIEFLQPRYFITYGQAYQETVEFMEFYNTSRIHGSLKLKPPMEVYEQYMMGQDIDIKAIRV